MSELDAAIYDRCYAILKGGKEAKKYSDYYKDKEVDDRNNYSGRFNLNTINKSSSGSISKGNINISSISSMSRTGPNLSGYGIYKI